MPRRQVDPSAVGIINNSGQTCYAAAALQALFRGTPAGARLVALTSQTKANASLPRHHGAKSAASAGSKLLTALGDLAAGLLTGQSGPCLSLTAVKTAATADHVEPLCHGGQQDSFLCFGEMLLHLRRHASPVVEGLFLRHVSSLRCLSCDVSRQAAQHTTPTLQLKFPSAQQLEPLSVGALLHSYFHAEAVEEVECSACGTRGFHASRHHAGSTPDVLTVQLGRFGNNDR